MTLRIPLQEAQHRLIELVHGLAADDEILIIEDDREIARIIGRAAQPAPGPRRPGGAKGKLIIVEDDDAHLADFRDYMP
jgi:antitoxin (DNA-binding transcriptional repressor) of toxin-antitoxin stability system